MLLVCKFIFILILQLFGAINKKMTCLCIFTGHISETIGKNLRRSSLVVETNPGLGILTKRLLDIGVHCINLYESNPHFFPHLCVCI